MSLIRNRHITLIAALAFGGLCVGSIAADLPKVFRKKDKTPKKDAATNAGNDKYWTEPVAVVDGETITRGQLAKELIANDGRRQLELTINRKIIDQALRKRKIKITNAEIEKEFDETIERLNLSRKEFIKTVLERREITLPQYVRENVWLAVALKKLVAESIKVTKQDLDKAFEANYGEKVRVRMLVVVEQRKAQKLWEKAHAEKDLDKRDELFGEMCKTYTTDAATRAYAGETQPIHRHTNYPAIEKPAFGLDKGELSEIIQVRDGHVILLGLGRIPARTDLTMDSISDEEKKLTVREVMTKDIREKKLSLEAARFSLRLRKQAHIANYLTGEFDPNDVAPLAAQPSTDAKALRSGSGN